MFKFIVKIFIKDKDNINNNEVKEKYGTLCSVLSIICNIIMVIFKLIYGFIMNSSALIADGYNNLSDAGSNVATLLGFQLANKHPDKEHPYGHGRYEYIAGLVIAFLILFVSISSIKESILKIISYSHVSFSYSAIIVIVVSIFMKLWMYSFNNYAGQKIESTSLKAAARDSLNDVITTSATLISLILGLYTTLPVDGIFGLIVSLIVLKSGIDIFKDTVNPLLGNAPDHKLIEQIQQDIKKYHKIIGTHDFMIHDYGMGHKYMTFHVEIDSHENIVDIHNQIDKLEREILEKYNILTAIHMDPIDTHDQRILQLKQQIEELVHQTNNEYTIHDFQYIEQENKISFDVVIPFDDKTEHSFIKEMIETKIKQINPEYNCDIQIEHSYI